MSAIMVGLSASIKHTGIAFLPIILLFIIYTFFRSKKINLWTLFKIMILFTLISVSIVLPWYTKTYIYTGNPLL